jgi:altronate dehydratase small subunit
VYVLNPKDNVATALRDLAAGERVWAQRDPGAGAAGRIEVEVKQAIAFGHKLALVAIARDEPVLKYGEAIGLAAQDIAPGEHVHTHNVESQRGRGDLAAGAGGAGAAPPDAAAT